MNLETVAQIYTGMICVALVLGYIGHPGALLGRRAASRSEAFAWVFCAAVYGVALIVAGESIFNLLH